MTPFVIRRLVLAMVQLLLVVTLVFLLLHLMPGDPVLVILGSEGQTNPDAVEAVRARLGLDQPLPMQYWSWLTDLVQLNLGTSLANGEPVWNDVAARLPRTLELIGVAVALGALFGIPLGTLAAINRNGPVDWLASAFTAIGISVPVYVVGTLAILVFALNLGWLPTSGYRDWSGDTIEHVRRLILPATTLALSPTAIVTRMTRSSLLDVLRSDYIRTARAKGVPNLHVLGRHGLRTSLIPVVTVIGLQIGTLIGGSVLVEYVFNWPGISTLLIQSIHRRDYPMVQGVIMVSATLFILLNLVVDMIYGLLDPRIRYE